jgi:hypothetical protein
MALLSIWARRAKRQIVRHRRRKVLIGAPERKAGNSPAVAGSNNQTLLLCLKETSIQCPEQSEQFGIALFSKRQQLRRPAFGHARRKIS